ncbi:hypothetical protein V493_07984 [Pseudogymnoascus sp. VKM F-4281 (FW-2241)]|nr:hypothetical protein V493_07984 [Pseudogymnoascus sp. VKM F-4281 (FW-2241)]
MAVCVDIFDEAFADDPAMIYLHPGSDPKVLKEKSIHNFEKSFTAPGVKYFKAILEETSEIAAFSKWVYPHPPDPNAEDPEKAIRTQQHVSGSNEELVVEFFTKFLRGRMKWMVPETHYFMSILAVRPQYQRRGLGSMLLSAVLEQVDKEHAKAFVQGSAQGIGLYLKHGWGEVDEILMDYSSYGGAEDVRTALLPRHTKLKTIVSDKRCEYSHYTNMGKIEAPIGCLNIPLPLCIRRLVKEPPVPVSRPGDEDVLNMIRKFGEKYDRHENEIRQACYLADGYSDIVVILKQPARNHDYSVDSKKFVAYCPTLNAVDKFIQFATNKTRSIENVSVFDSLSFRPNDDNGTPPDDECYLLVENMLKAKRPKVVICSWKDDNATCNNDFIKRFLGGGFKEQPLLVRVPAEWKAPVVIVRSFHPSAAINYRKYNPDYQVLLIYHFIAAFSELGQRIQEPLWLADINTRCRADIKAGEDDPLTKWGSLSDPYEEAYKRASGILKQILGPVLSQTIGIELKDYEIYLLLRRLGDSEYKNGSTEISKLYILWKEYFGEHHEYELGLDLLIQMANEQERFDPKGFDPKDDLMERLQNLAAPNGARAQSGNPTPAPPHGHEPGLSGVRRRRLGGPTPAPTPPTPPTPTPATPVIAVTTGAAPT